MASAVLLEGLHIPLTTPFNADGSVALDKLARNVTRYSKTPTAGLIVLGPSGEPTLLSDDETRDVLRTAAEAAAPEKVLLAGIARDSVRSVLALADFAAEHHYDAVLVGVPSTFPSTRSDAQARQLLTYFRAIADRSPLPVILRSTHACPISTDEIVELAVHPNIIGAIAGPFGAIATGSETESILRRTASLKREVVVTTTFAAVTARMKLVAEAAPTLVSAASLTGSATAIAEPPALTSSLRTRIKSVGFQLITSNTPKMLEPLNAGAAGIAPAFAAAAPQACYEIYAAWKDGDQPLAEEKQERVRHAARIGNEVVGIDIGRLKYACDLNGYAAGLPRLPHLPPTGEQRAALEALMQGLRN